MGGRGLILVGMALAIVVQNGASQSSPRALSEPPSEASSLLFGDLRAGAQQFVAIPRPAAPEPTAESTPAVFAGETGLGSLHALALAAAAEHAIPGDFFVRLIRQESGFDPRAVSPKGAQGIAQFMPGTAAERGLSDPFDPRAALPASARLLRDLRERFGSLGLAAAAYNAGSQRVADWLAGRSFLPQETHQYVRAITGVEVEHWAGGQANGPVRAAAANETSTTLRGLAPTAGSSTAAATRVVSIRPDGDPAFLERLLKEEFAASRGRKARKGSPNAEDQLCAALANCTVVRF